MPTGLPLDLTNPPTLDVPNGVGTTLPLDPALAQEPSGSLPVAQASKAGGGLFSGLSDAQRNFFGLAIAGLADVLSARFGKEGTALKTTLGLQQANLAAKRETRAQETEERRAKTEEEKLGLERGRFTLEQIKEARLIQTQELEAGRVFLKDASELAGRLATIPDAGQRAAAVNAMVDEAEVRGGRRLATVVRGILQQPDVGKFLGPLVRHLPPSMAPGLLQEGALLLHKGESDKALAKAQVLALPDIANTLFQRIDSLSADLRAQSKDKLIPLAVLEAAVKAANPSDAAGSNPELGLLRGVGEVYSKAAEIVKDRLAARGFEMPGTAAEVAKETALGPVKTQQKVAEQTALLPGKVKEQEALQPGKVAVAAATGREAAQSRLEIPEKASPRERELLTEESASLEQINTLSSLYQQDFVGPVVGRASGIGERVGAISAPNAEFRAALARLRNQVIKQITGAQMSEQEAGRIREQLPETTNPPLVFEARLRQTAGNIEVLAKRRREILGQTGVDISKLPPLPKVTLPGGLSKNDLSGLSDAELKKKLGL